MRNILLVLTIALIPGLLNAEEFKQELDEVVVTASRVSEKIKNTPVAVNVISESELATVKARNPYEILSRIPGVNSQRFGGESELTAIRVPTHFTNPYTIVLLDGVPTTSYGSGSSSQFSEINSENIARIETIKGPASALYGSNAIGGIINIISKTPAADPQAKLWSEVGDHSQHRSGLSASAGDGPLAFNLDLSMIDSNNWREHSGLNKQAATFKSFYTSGEESLLTFKVDLLKSEGESPGTLSEADFYEDWQHSYQTFTYKKIDKIAPAVTFNRYFDVSELSATLAFRDIEEESIPNYSIRAGRSGGYTGSMKETESQDFDLQLLYSHNFPATRGKIIAGLDLVRGNKTSDSTDLEVTRDDVLNLYTSHIVGDLDKSYDILTKVSAPYIQLEISPIEKLKFSTGARYDSVEYEVEDLLDAGAENDKKFSNLSPKAGLTYEISSSLNGYLSYAEGFVVPTTSQLWTSRYDNSDLQAEKAQNYEIGLRSVFLRNKLRIDGSIYSMDITDKVVVNDDESMYINAGKTSQEGIELMTVYTPHSKARLTIAYTYARNKYDEYTDSGIDYSDNTQPRSPKHHLNARLAVYPIHNLEVELEMDEISSQYGDDANLLEYNRPTLVNLRVGYDWQQWSVWGHILNLTDETYATYISESDDELTLYSGEERTILAGLSYKFGASK